MEYASVAINERCVALGVRRDEELNALFPGHICNGGEVPYIHEAVQEATQGASTPPSAFDRCFAALVQSSACGFDGFGVGIDPRDGLHYAFALKTSNSSENGNAGIGSRTDLKDSSDDALSAIPVPELDCCCALPVECRREAACESLPTEARSVLDAEQGARQGPRHTAKELLRCIRQEQARTDYCLDPCVFRCLVHTACNRQAEKQIKKKSLSGAVWSGEALQALQAIAEAHVLGLCKAALLEALHAGRVLLLPDDLRRAQAKSQFC